MAAIYNTPQVSGLGSYNLGKMSNLFQVDTQTSGTIDQANGWTDPAAGGLTWTYETPTFMASVPGGHSSGQAWTDGTYDYVEFDNGSGVRAPVPEPSTLFLVAAGLSGLMAYAWRKRRN